MLQNYRLLQDCRLLLRFLMPLLRPYFPVLPKHQPLLLMAHMSPLPQQNQHHQQNQGFQLLQDCQLRQDYQLRQHCQLLPRYQLLQDQSPLKDLVNRMLPWSHHQ